MADSIEVMREMRDSWAELGSKAYDKYVAACDAAIRALSPAGGDWVMVDGRRYAVETVKTALLGLASDVLAASPQQEPGADEFSRVAASGSCPACGSYGPCVDASACGNTALDPSGQTLAGAGGEGERTLKQVGWMRFKNGGAEISTAQECPPDRSAGNASHWFAIHAYEARRNG